MLQECKKVSHLERFFHINGLFLSITNKFCQGFPTYRGCQMCLILLNSSILAQFYNQQNSHLHLYYCHHHIKVRIFFHHHIFQRNNLLKYFHMSMIKVGIHWYSCCTYNLRYNQSNMLNMVNMKHRFDTILEDKLFLLYINHFWKSM